MAVTADVEAKPIWDKEIQVVDNTAEKRKNNKSNGLCEIVGKIIIGFLIGGIVLAISVIENVAFATMAHRDSTFGVQKQGALSHVGLEGVSHMGFLFAVIIPDIRSFFYCVHFWFFRGARFPIKTFKLWVPAILTECMYAGGQGLFIFFVAPYLEDSTMILGSFLILTVPIILSIIFPEFRYTSWDSETQTFSEEKQQAYAKRKRIVYGIALAFNIAGFVFFWLEIVQNAISDEYWTLVEQIDGSKCRDNCRAGMAVAAFFLMSLSSWLNFIHDNHENSRFGHSVIQDFKEAKTRELQIFPIYTIAALFRISINVSLWILRERRVDKFAGDNCDPSTNINFGKPISHLKLEYSACPAAPDSTCLYMNLETWLALFATLFIISDWLLVTISKIAVRSKLHRIGFLLPLIASPIVSSMLLAYHPITAESRQSGSATQSNCIPNDILYRFTHSSENFDASQHWAFYGTLGCGVISLVLVTLYLWTDRSFVYALDRHLFSIPVFRPIFSSTSLLLHRKREDDPDKCSKIFQNSYIKTEIITTLSINLKFE